MKLLILLTAAACLQASANGFGQTVTLSLKSTPLENAFKEIKKQTGYSFVYTRAQLKNTLSVSLQLKNAELKEALELCFLNQPLSFVIEGHYVVVQTKSSNIQFSPIDVNGRIINEKGEPVEGASVVIKGTQNGTTTNMDGFFELKDIHKNVILIITGINIQTTEIKVADETDITIRVKTRITGQEEVIINAGYYKTTDRLKTGNISRVDAETIAKQPVSNPLAALQGRVPGLYIQQNTGVPGSSFNIQIRGQNSLRSDGNDPLFIIDGVPFTSSSLASDFSAIINKGSSLSNINPSDLESIEILKDADATAIYGSRGANGVIIITTKKGKAGKTRADVNLYRGIGKVTRMMELLNTNEYLVMRHEAFKNDNRSIDQNNIDINGIWDTTRYTDWQDVLIGGTAKIMDAQFSVSGGNENIQILVGGGYHKETTVFPGNFNNQKKSAHFSINNSSANKKFKLTSYGSYLTEENTLPIQDVTAYALRLPPNAPTVFNTDGTLNWGPVFFDNPYAYLQQKFNINTHTLISNTSLAYLVAKGLEAKITFGYSSYQSTDMSTTPISSFNPIFSGLTGSSVFANYNLNSWITEPQINYHKATRSGKLNVLIGLTFQEDIQKGQTFLANGYTSDAMLENIQAAPSLTVWSSAFTEYRYNAIFGRFSYAWDEKYLVNLTGRRDGSSRFGRGRQFGNFGALGLGWIFSSEKFSQNKLKFLSYGKLRVSYGITGSDRITDYGYYSTYTPTNFQYQGSGLIPYNLYNPDFRWETNKKLETALELGFIKNKILFTIAYRQTSWLATHCLYLPDSLPSRVISRLRYRTVAWN